MHCPCHQSRYDRLGIKVDGERYGPAPRGMDRFAIRVVGDSVVVDTGAAEEGPAKGILTGPSEPSGPSCLGGEGAGPGDTGGMGGMDEGTSEIPGTMP